MRALTASALAAVLFAVGCAGGDGETEEQARPQAGGGSVTAVGGQEMVDAQLALARCMRAQGIDFPDPKPGGGHEFDPAEAGISEERLGAAEENCEKEQQAVQEAAPQVSEEQRQADRDATLRFARCMREQGQDVADPGAQGPASETAVEVPPDAKTDPAFQAAQRKCEHIMREVDREGS